MAASLVLVVTLACIAVLLLAGLIAARVAADRDRELAAGLGAQVRTLTLRASTQVRAVRVTPNPRSWSASADATLGWPEPPEMLDVYLPVAYSDFKVFAVTMDKVDVGRVLDIQRMTADSNGELRLALNSSAFGPGEYRIRLQGGGQSVGFVAVNGTEIHILPLAEKKAMSRRNILEFLEPIFAEHGYATTRVPVSVTDHRLREKLGFRETWRDEQFIYFAAYELPFQRKPS